MTIMRANALAIERTNTILSELIWVVYAEHVRMRHQEEPEEWKIHGLIRQDVDGIWHPIECDTCKELIDIAHKIEEEVEAAERSHQG